MADPAPRPSAPAPHTARQVAESFGSDAERYDRTRPHYPPAMVEAVVRAAPGPAVLDVGIGTGVSAQPFRAAGCRVLGVEPDERMAQFARGRGYEVEVAQFEDWDPRGRSFDAVTAGQSWHWVDPVAGAAKAAGILKPGGGLAVFWNVFLPPPGLAARFNEVYGRVVPDSPFSRGTMPGLDGYARILEAAADGVRRSGRFGEPEQLRFDWQQTYDRDEWLDQVPTFGGHSLIPPDQMEELLDGIGSAIDAVGGSFVMGYAAMVVMAPLAEARGM
jgi:SAM-dependent methyltransferase